MENASKALLIAGAILIVILLIAAGMLIFNKGNETISGASNQADVMTNKIGEAGSVLNSVNINLNY